MKPLWPHQERGLQALWDRIDAGAKAICLTSPTGGGKTRLVEESIWQAKSRGWPVVVYTNRTMLREQLHRVLGEAGIMHGTRAAGSRPDSTYQVQLASVQTEYSRVYKTKVWAPLPPGLAIIDEAHVITGEMAHAILVANKDAGGINVGVTATPIDLADLYDELIVAGVNSELRACGALVPAVTFGPDEPVKVKMTKTGEITEGESRKAIMTPTIFARVLEHFKRLNPDGRPTILFAPGVKESIWFAEQFRAAGITAAHIDGADISYGEVDEAGESVTQRTSKEKRAEILAESKSGRVQVLCNRFVMREGIDCPWLSHVINATVFGTLGTFLQADGRSLRTYPGKERTSIQDHGGNWWRYGSLNADRVWDLTWSNRIITGIAHQNQRDKKQPEPIHCPRCSRIRPRGPKCPECGYEQTGGKSRPVVQTDGTLKEMKGDIFKPRVIREYPNTQKKWDRMFHKMRNAGMTFTQAEGLYFTENHYYPPRTLANQPTGDIDWFLKVADVPRERLRLAEVKAVEKSLF